MENIDQIKLLLNKKIIAKKSFMNDLIMDGKSIFDIKDRFNEGRYIEASHSVDELEDILLLLS